MFLGTTDLGKGGGLAGMCKALVISVQLETDVMCLDAAEPGDKVQ
jgi:hypothetical protein